MKKSEFKEYLKTELRKMHEAEIEVDNAETAAEVAKEIPDATIKVSEFKNFLRQEILNEINEQEEESEVDTEPNVDTFNFDQPDFGGEGELDDITKELVKLAKDAKKAGELELANQILNSAKFSYKTEFKQIEKEV